LRSRRRRRRRRVFFTVLLTILAVMTFLLVSVIGAWRTPGNENFKAKWADWLRGHHASLVVNHMEAFYYGHHRPPKGGSPKTLNPVPIVAPAAPPVVERHGLPAPPAVPLVVQPGLPGEGQWSPTGPLVNGSTAMYVAQFRADSTYTSELTTAVWIDPTRLHVSLVPGAREPGGTWSHPPYITQGELPKALAAFNGGFRMKDAHGGFFLAGREQAPLREGAASVVIYDSGRMVIGAWGSEIQMGPHVSAVLQNLVLMVDGGRVNPAVSHDDTKLWGSTLGVRTVVPRSGIGVTADGALVYVAGPALTALSLAESLQRAGAVRAMTLDINPEWVTFNFYSHPDASKPLVVDASKLYPRMYRSATRYLGPTKESRDFFLISSP
jgi:hypothetical protein